MFASAGAQDARRIGTIDVFGLRAVTEQQVRTALQIKEGDEPPSSRPAFEAVLARLEAIHGVEEATIDFPCCSESGKYMLYVGIREKGTPALKFRSAPSGKVSLPDKTVQLGSKFFDALEKAVLKGEAGEDDSAGHSFSKNAEVRAIQEQFITIAAKDGRLLQRVLRDSFDPYSRSLAALIIAYSPDKRKIVNDLVSALKDIESDVRNNAVRALWVLALYARKDPAKKIYVPLTPIIQLVNSVVWTDRNKSSLALLALTEGRNAKLLKTLREKALPSLFEMARWKSEGHAFAGVVILGRIAGLPDSEIFEALQNKKKVALLEKIKIALSSK